MKKGDLEETVRTFNKYASQYFDKYASHKPYLATYEAFSTCLTEDHTKVLDVACGPGHFSRFLLDRNPALQINGIDLAPDMIELARRNIPSGNFSVLDSRLVASLNQSFDVVLLGFCIPYLSREETTELLRSTADMLEDSGLLYLSTMEGDYLRSGFQANESEDRVFTYFHSEEFLTDQLVSNGFEITHIERQTMPAGQTEGTDDLFIYARLRSA